MKRSSAALRSSAVLGMALFPSAVGAATIVVNSIADTTATDGQCTLREALNNANTNADTTSGDCQPGQGLDTIVVSNVTGTIVLALGQLEITDSANVQGSGLSISAGGQSRVFAVGDASPASQLDVVLESLTIQDGNGYQSGGGILNDGENLTIANVNLTNNSSDAGGGVAAIGQTSSLTILNSTISGNAGGGVGARYAASLTIQNSNIANNGPAPNGGGGGGVVLGGLPYTTTQSALTVTNTVISGNRSDDGGGGVHVTNASGSIISSTINQNESAGGGGALYAGYSSLTIDNSVAASNRSSDSGGAVYSWFSDLTISNSMISSNVAGYDGGGVYATYGHIAISDSTIDGNASSRGGGIHIVTSYYGGESTIVNSTISGNRAGNGGGVFLSLAPGSTMNFDFATIADNTASVSGGGIYISNNGSAELDHSIVGNNIAPDGDLGGPGAVGATFSLIENPGSISVTDRGGSIFGLDPQLGPLQNNGGPTTTHLPEVGSPVIDAGDPAFAGPPSTDQRGGPRPVRRVDIGAVEVNPGVVEFTQPAYSVAEDAGVVAVTLTRTGGFDGPVQVDVLLSNGSGTVGSDITPAAATASFNTGESTATVTFNVNDDSLQEGDETINLTLSNVRRATLGAQSSAVLTIIDDDAAGGDVSVTKTASTDNSPTGSDLTYTIVVQNGGPGQAVNVQLIDVLPEQTTFQSMTVPAEWNCAAPPVGETGNVTCSTPSLAANATATLLFTVNVDCATPDGAVLTNRASVMSSDDPNSANNSSAATTMSSNASPMIVDANVSISVLWPANHKMVDVMVNYGVTDNCGPVSTVLSVTSNEPAGIEPDWEIVNEHHVRLRAERSGSGSGRIYTITITATDSAGHSVSEHLTVTVPHSRK